MENQFKGTSGPWHASTPEHGVFIVTENNYCLAKIDNELNAQLIAAAPELLEALQECRSALIKASMIDMTNTCSKAADLASGAINKALGKEVTQWKD